jgi:HPt (histidine-containing phosphotransfer) domain-containing protein
MAEELTLDLDDFLPLIRLFLEVSAEDLDRLDAAYRLLDLPAAAAAAHSIKGAAANLGFSELAATAAAIEQQARLGDASPILAGSDSLRAALAAIRREL